jgi:two-component system, response regulator
MSTTIRLPVEDHTLTRKTILLVEDDSSDAELTLLALRRSNISNKVIVARDGEEALEFLHGGGEAALSEHGLERLPAVVLLDLKLPKMSGLDVLRKIRSDPRTRRVPVVILTSSVEEKDVLEGYELGANSFICKPVDFEKFTEAVGTLGLYWVLMNEAAPVRQETGQEINLLRMRCA